MQRNWKRTHRLLITRQLHAMFAALTERAGLSGAGLARHQPACRSRFQPFLPATAHSMHASARGAVASRGSVAAAAAKEKSGKAPLYTPTSARDAIETADARLKKDNDTAEAIRLYKLALDMRPSDEEATACWYNLGCALAKAKQWQPAVDAIVTAVNDYNLKIIVPLKVQCS